MASSNYYTDEAIVLRQKDWGSADKILTLYTKGRGLVRAAAYGSRRLRSPLAGIQPFGEIRVTLTGAAAGSRLDTIRQYTSLNRHPAITGDIQRLAYGSLIAEVADRLSPELVPDEAVYSSLAGALVSLARRNPRLVAISAVIKLLRLNGWGEILPEKMEETDETNGWEESLPPEAEELFGILSDLDWNDPPSFTAKRSQIAACENYVMEILARRTGCRPRSLAFIRQLR